MTECFSIGDNLSNRTNKAIKEFTKTVGMHMKYIMPGASRWFQVHGQQPFGTLKKKNDTEKILSLDLYRD